MTEGSRAACPSRPRWWATAGYAACAWALLFAVTNVYWGLGGRLALPISDPDAASGGAALVALNWVAAAVKVGLGLLALATVRPCGRRLPRGPLLGASYGLGGSMALYGALGLAVNGLRLLGAIAVPASAWTSLRWHVFLWDPWLIAGGVLFTAAARRYRRRAPVA